MKTIVSIALILALVAVFAESHAPKKGPKGKTLVQYGFKHAKEFDYEYNPKQLGVHYKRKILPTKFTRSHLELARVFKNLSLLKVKLFKQKKAHAIRTKKAKLRMKFAHKKFLQAKKILKEAKRRFLKAKQIYSIYAKQKIVAFKHINNELNLLGQLFNIVGNHHGKKIPKKIKKPVKKPTKKPGKK